MYNNEDFERLFIRYKGEAYPKGESIQTFCHRNNVPYNLFEKWYKDTRKQIPTKTNESFPLKIFSLYFYVYLKTVSLHKEAKLKKKVMQVVIEIPNTGNYDINELKQKLSLYAKKLIEKSISHQIPQTKPKVYRHEALCGMLEHEDGTDLRAEYVKEKYGV